MAGVEPPAGELVASVATGLLCRSVTNTLPSSDRRTGHSPRQSANAVDLRPSAGKTSRIPVSRQTPSRWGPSTEASHRPAMLPPKSANMRSRSHCASCHHAEEESLTTGTISKLIRDGNGLLAALQSHSCRFMRRVIGKKEGSPGCALSDQVKLTYLADGRGTPVTSPERGHPVGFDVGSTTVSRSSIDSGISPEIVHGEGQKPCRKLDV